MKPFGCWKTLSQKAIPIFIGSFDRNEYFWVGPTAQY